MYHQMFTVIADYIKAQHKAVSCVRVNHNKFEIGFQEQKLTVRYDPSEYIFFDALHGSVAGYFSFSRSADGIFSLVLKNRQPMECGGRSRSPRQSNDDDIRHSRSRLRNVFRATLTPGNTRFLASLCSPIFRRRSFF